MSAQPLTEDQTDALQEVANIAMGQAGKSLSMLLDTFVTLSVPRVMVVDVQDVAPAVAAMTCTPEDVTAVRQAFFPGLRGEAIALFGARGCSDLADLLGHEGEIAAEQERELLLDTANILIGAVLTGLGEQIGAEFSYTPPSILAVHSPVTKILQVEHLDWSTALLIEVRFTLEDRGFTCHLLTLMPEGSIDVIRTTLDRILDEL